MNSLSLDAAKAVLDAAFAEAAARDVANAAVVVVDMGGHIRAAQRSDGWGAFGVDIAVAKARTALGFNRASILSAAGFKDNPAGVTGINAAVGGNFIPLAGGVIVTNDEGQTIGAAAFAGGMPDVDHAIIVAAVKSAGLVTPE